MANRHGGEQVSEQRTCHLRRVTIGKRSLILGALLLRLASASRLNVWGELTAVPSVGA
jgi:hypothetical protein